MRGIFIDKVVREIEIDNLPGDHVADRRDERDQNADREGAAETDRPATEVFAIRANSEEDQQESQHDAGVADDIAFVEADPVSESKRDVQQQHHDGVGNKPEGQKCLFYRINLTTDYYSELWDGNW